MKINERELERIVEKVYKNEMKKKQHKQIK